MTLKNLPIARTLVIPHEESPDAEIIVIPHRAEDNWRPAYDCWILHYLSCHYFADKKCVDIRICCPKNMFILLQSGQYQLAGENLTLIRLLVTTELLQSSSNHDIMQ